MGVRTAYTTTGTSDRTMQTDGNVETVANRQRRAHRRRALQQLLRSQHEVRQFGDPTPHRRTQRHQRRARHDLAPLGEQQTLGVYSLAATATDLYVGGDFNKLGGVDQEHYADLPIIG
jgi:hypothetical protein